MLAVAQGLAPTRARAQALILAGAVMSGPDRKVLKPGDLLDSATELSLRGQPLPFVSRGGLKLAAALERFAINPTGKICLDVGASTGGFTDCLLKAGASKVYAVDVGYGQMAWEVRQDPRVVVIERENIRTLPKERIPEAAQLVVIDVSFISLALVLPPVIAFLAEGAQLAALVKPQFEVGRGAVGKGGIVRDEQARQQALEKIVATAQSLGFCDVQTMDSPILGQKGNHEFLLGAHL